MAEDDANPASTLHSRGAWLVRFWRDPDLPENTLEVLILAREIGVTTAQMTIGTAPRLGGGKPQRIKASSRSPPGAA